jgi:hypothetical protein
MQEGGVNPPQGDAYGADSSIICTLHLASRSDAHIALPLCPVPPEGGKKVGKEGGTAMVDAMVKAMFRELRFKLDTQ